MSVMGDEGSLVLAEVRLGSGVTSGALSTQHRPSQFSGVAHSHVVSSGSDAIEDAPRPLPRMPQGCATERDRRVWVMSLPLEEKLALLDAAVRFLDRVRGTTSLLLPALIRGAVTAKVLMRHEGGATVEEIPLSPIILRALDNGSDIIQQAFVRFSY